jgi:hypothetical protein
LAFSPATISTAAVRAGGIGYPSAGEGGMRPTTICSGVASHAVAITARPVRLGCVTVFVDFIDQSL